jgi:putative FmdB family regulatory protein
MPTYEYECNSCGHNFEAFQNMSDEPVGECPECGGKVKRLLGKGAGIIFKGSGFYATDYKNNRPSCGREKPCCGRDVPCDKRPCNE